MMRVAAADWFGRVSGSKELECLGMGVRQGEGEHWLTFKIGAGYQV